MSKSTNPAVKLDAHHIVAGAMAEFWDEDGIESYKASHLDGVRFADTALRTAGFQPQGEHPDHRMLDLATLLAGSNDATLATWKQAQMRADLHLRSGRLQAADNAGYALGTFGVDWRTDTNYHVVIAAILMGEGDV